MSFTFIIIIISKVLFLTYEIAKFVSFDVGIYIQKKGLSKFYNGKSRAFTSLANLTGLEDLEKPENPYNKILKLCSNYGRESST